MTSPGRTGQPVEAPPPDVNLKALLALLLAICAPFTGLAAVGPALVLARGSLREIRASDGSQRGLPLAVAAIAIGVAGVALIGVMAWGAATEDPVGELPREDLPAFLAVLVATALAAAVTWLVAERLRAVVVKVVVAVVGVAAVVGILAAGFADPGRVTTGLEAGLIAGGAALGLVLSLAALRWVVTHRGTRRPDDGGEAGIATSLEGLRSSTNAFRRPEARDPREPEA